MPVRLNGSTSGYVELAAPAVAGATSLELPTDSIKPGLVLVAAQSFTAASSISVNNCFTATYENYRIVMTGSHSTGAGTQVSLRLRASGVDQSGANYFVQYLQGTGSSALAGRNNSVNQYEIGLFAQRDTLAVEMPNPNTSAIKVLQSTSTYNSTNGIVIITYAAASSITTACDGFTAFVGSGTMTGTLRVYGYRNSL